VSDQRYSVTPHPIAHQDDQRLRRALPQVAVIEFYRYDVNFKLHKS
jgi:hypothetical protein